MNNVDFIEPASQDLDNTSDVNSLSGIGNTSDVNSLSGIGNTCLQLIGQCNGSIEATAFEKMYSCAGLAFVCTPAVITDGVLNIHNQKIAQDVSAIDEILKDQA